MRRVLLFSVFLFAFTASVAAQSPQPVAKAHAAQPTATSPASPAAVQEARASFAKLPLSFEENAGQTDARVKYTSRGTGYSLFLTSDEAVFALEGGASVNCAGLKGNAASDCTRRALRESRTSDLWLKMAGANPSARIVSSDPLPGKINYYIGNDPSKWRTGVRQFGRVTYQGIYPGVDLTYYGNEQQLESDFVVAPGASPRSIEYEVTGAREVQIDAEGNLALVTSAGNARLLRPQVYQLVNSTKREISGRYILRGQNRIGFEIGKYDKRDPLIIDPVLVYSTLLGGASLSSGGDSGNAIAIDSTGDAFVTGAGRSPDFPGTAAGAVSPNGSFDFVFVTKFDPNGNTLLYSTLLRGTTGFGTDQGNGIGVDGSGKAYVDGITTDSDFPLLNPFQATIGDDPIQVLEGFNQSGFVSGLDSNGNLIYSTYFGGRNSGDQNFLTGLAADSSGDAYVVGYTSSQNFPTVLATQATLNGFENAIVAKFDPNGQPIYSTYLGGDADDLGNAIAVDASGAAYVTGETDSSTFPVQAAPVFQAALAGSENLFVAKFTFDTTLHLAQSTYLGGSETDIGYGIAVDTATPKPNVYLTGQTTSTVNTTGFTIFPTLNPIFTLPANNSSAFTNAFVTKLKGDFSALLYSTLLGATSTSTATGTAIGVDGAATPNAYVTGFTTGQNFPVANALQAVLAANTGGQNLFVTEVNGAGSALTYSTYLGGRTGDEAKGIAVDASGNAYITGAAGSVNFPVFATVGQPYQSQLGTSSGNAFAVKISPAAAPSGLNFFPPAVSFGNQGVQFISPGQDITLSNNSASAITLNSLSLGGSNPADFTLTPGTCVNGALLTAGSSCVTVLQFSPTQQDARSATLTVSSTPASAAALTLSGTGVVPEVAVNPSAVHFGTKVPLNVPALSGIQIENTGGGSLIIGNVQITGADASAFSTTLGSNCTISVVPFGNCFVTVTLNATTARAYSASLLINDNAVGSPQIVTLDGTAVAQVAVSPTAIEYGGWLLGTQSPDREIIVTNETGGNITLTGIAATGTNSGDFLVDATPPNSGGAQPCNTTPFPTMLPGVSCSFYVFFKPLTPGTTDVVDGRTATYTVSWNGAATGSQAIAVMGAAETGVTLYQNTFVAPDEFVGATERGPEIDQLFNGTANPITVTGITLGGSTPQDFQIQLDNSCSVNGTIPANSICFLDGSFSPSAVGPRSVTATINYTGAPPGTSLTLTVTGNGLAGPVTFGSSFNFGSQVSGVTSPTHRVFLENIGKGALTISNITAPAGTDFAWINRTAEGACSPTGPTATVPGGGKCFVDVTFTPSTTGSRTATLVITDNAPGSPRTLSLSGTGEPAVQMISVSPNALDFGNVALVGSGTQPTVTETFYLTNSGSQPATVTVPPALTTTTGTPFTIGTLAAAGTCGGTTLKPIPTVLAQGGFCSVIVQYKPTATGQLTNSATLSAKVGTTTTVFTVPIQGTGVDQGVLSVTPGSLTFSETANTTGGPVQNVTLTNTGSGPLVVSLLATAGPNASSFVLGAPTGATPPPTCVVGTTGMTIAAGASCATGVSFNAPGSIGKYTATLLIQANLGNNVLYPTPSTSSFPLTGNVVSGSFGVSPTPPLNFGNVAIGTTVNFSSINPINPVTFSSEISLTNNTISAVTITGIAAQNADYAIVASSCTGALAVTGSCTFDATFKPTVNGAENTNFVVSYTVAGVTGTQTFNIAVNGTGTTALIAEPNTPTVTTSVGNGTSVTVTIANGSSSTVNFVGSATVTGTGYSLSFDECATALTLAASSSCDTFINFNPTTPGSSQGQLVFKYTVGGGSQQTLTVTINGTATAAQVSIAVNTLPSTQTYPNQNINTRSLILDVVVTNTGNASLDINASNLKITGTNSNDFSFAESNFSLGGFNTSCELPVSPGQSCTIPIAYTPGPAPLPGGTTRNATLTITDNAFPSTTQTVNLVGNAPAGSVTASPSSLGFGSLNVGSSITQNVLVTNTTNAAVTFSNPIATFATGTSPSSYSIDATQTSNACTASTQLIAHTGSCVLYIKFTPAVVGSNTATATINTSGGAPTVALSGTGVATVVFVSPTSLTFSSQAVGTASAAQTITLHNPTGSSATVSGTAPAFSGTNASDFSIGTNTCTGSTVAAGSTCTVTVIFTPAASGGTGRSATITIADTTPAASFPVTLSGTAIAPVASLNVTTMPFGSSNVGVATAQQTVTLTNTGNATLNISSVALVGTNAGDFALVTPASGTDCRTAGTLTASASCVVAATFTPTAANSRSATITITDNATPTTQVITLSGTGTQPGVGLSLTTIPFGSQLLHATSAQSTTVLTNSGTGSLSISSVAITGTNPGDYALVTPSGVGVSNCITVGTLAAGSTCTMAVTFTPSALGSRTATVTITDTASTSPQSVALTGTGTAPAVTLNPTPTLAFGNQIVTVASTQQTITLTNTGSASLTIATVAIAAGGNAGDFAIVSGAGTTCVANATISATAGSNTCTVALTFTPGATGARTATLTFTDNATATAGSTQSVSLTGTGQAPPTATLSTSSVPFVNQRVGTTSAATIVTITNNGDATLAIASIVLDATGNPSDFLLSAGASNPCPLTGGTVAGHASCTFNVAFKPATATAFAATVNITDNGNATGTAGTKQTVALSGTGTAPAAQVAGTLPFGNQPINQTSTMPLTLTNNGTDTLNLAATNAVAITTGTNSTLFGIGAGTTCTNGVAIAAHASCTINVTFAPTAVGSFGPVTLVITDDSGAVTGSTQAVTLTGSGVTASVNFAPSPVNFTPSQNVGTTSSNVTVTLTNSGGLAVHLAAANSVVLGGTNAGDFAIVSSGTTCINSATVATGGGACVVILNFKPTAAGARTATLTVTDDANPTTQSVTLNGTGIAPVASVPSTLSFGNQLVSVASASQTVTLTNTGSASLTIATVAIAAGGNAGDFAIVSGAGTTCVANATISATAGSNTCTVALTFTPGATGARTATLTFTDNATATAGSTQSVSLTGTGQAPPTATLSTSSVPFVNQRVGTTSAATIVTITNNGDATLAIASIVLDATGNPSDFLLSAGASNPCPLTGGTVAGHASCTFNVAFKPATATAFAATVNITDNGNATGTAGTKQTVALSGTGTAPAAQVAGTLPFGNQPINQTSTMPLTLTNNGTDTLNLAATNAVAITTGTNSTLFGIGAGTTCTNGVAIAAHASCTINVTFAPTAVGSFGPVTLVITDDSGAVSGSTQAVTLTGSGVTSTVNFNTATVQFGSLRVGTSSAQMSTVLTNSGSSALAISAVNLGGANPSDFALVTPTSGTDCRTIGSVAAAGTCTIAATFTPTATLGRSAVVSVHDNAPGSPHSFSLAGTGTSPAVTLSTNSVTFTNQIQTTTSAQQTITVTNSGTATLNIGTVVLGGTNPADFAIVSGSGTTCVASAAIGFTAPNNTCTIAVTFTPATANPFSAAITLTDDANPTTQVVNLSGTGLTPPTATPSPTSLTFTGQPTTTTSAAQTVTLTNSGGAPLSITSIAFTGTNPGDFKFASPATTCPTAPGGGQVAAGANCVLSVTFAPTATGARSASISIVVTGIANPAPVTLSGTGTAPDVAIAKSHVGNFEVGVNGTYTIKLTNNGTAATQQPITVTDTLPAGLGFVSGTGTGWTCSAAAQAVTCTNPGPINTGSANASTITLTVSVAAPAFPGVTNSATVTDAGDSGAGTADKSSTDAPTTVTAPDVTIAKSHTGDFTVGSNGVYTIKVTNSGTGATTGNITVTDTLPAGLAFVSNTGAGWACAANAQVVTCTYTGAALAAAGGNSTFTMTVSVAPGAFPSVTNSATVADPNDAKTTDKSATDAATNIDNALPTTQSSISPALGLIAGATSPQQIILTGTGFNSSTIVTLGSTAPLNTPLTGTANAAGTSLTINVPANELAIAGAGSLTLTVSNPKNPTSNLGGGTATTNPTFPLVAMSSLTPQSGTANPVPIVAGTPFALQMNLNLTPSGTALPADVTITCSFPMALAGATCTPTPGTIAHGSTLASTVITINAIPTSGSVVGPSTFTPWNGGQGPWAQYLLWLTVAALLSMLAMLRTVRQRAPQFGRASAYLTLVLLVFAAGALVGCTSAAKTTPTPTGPSSITVTATTADGATVSATVNITVTN